jgi:hypothetical protein
MSISNIHIYVRGFSRDKNMFFVNILTYLLTRWVVVVILTIIIEK